MNDNVTISTLIDGINEALKLLKERTQPPRYAEHRAVVILEGLVHSLARE